MRARLVLVLVLVLVLAGALLGAFANGYGPLLTCGADGAAVCVEWPAALGGLLWLAFVAMLVGLSVIQVRLSGRPVASDEHAAADRG